MTQIRVIEIVGPVCVDPEDGARLCGVSYAALSNSEAVVLDFTGVSTLTSSFLHAAIGCLFGRLSIDTVTKRLATEGLDETDNELMQLVIKNAVRYYGAAPDQQQAMAAASQRAIDD